MAQLPKKNSKLKRNNYLIYRQKKPPEGGRNNIYFGGQKNET